LGETWTQHLLRIRAMAARIQELRKTRSRAKGIALRTHSISERYAIAKILLGSLQVRCSTCAILLPRSLIQQFAPEPEEIGPVDQFISR
jgi:hypothetical protein